MAKKRKARKKAKSGEPKAPPGKSRKSIVKTSHLLRLVRESHLAKKK